jgi:CubicO group peptidase (beta-lactamase class C family)
MCGSNDAERPDDMTFESGGQGLWSTLDDYLAFARIFLGSGEVDGVRLLRPETCAMMASNQLTSDQRRPARMLGMPVFAAGYGYGMGVAVRRRCQYSHAMAMNMDRSSLSACFMRSPSGCGRHCPALEVVENRIDPNTL